MNDLLLAVLLRMASDPLEQHCECQQLLFPRSILECFVLARQTCSVPARDEVDDI